MRFNITVSEELKKMAPQFVGGAITAHVKNTKYSEFLWGEIKEFGTELKQTLTIPEIKNLATIDATRTVYKKCGKDPNRYRPAAEALRRRILKGQSLYQINTLVDLVNLVSIATGYSMGGFDADLIVGDNLVLGVGKEGEVFEGIGRGLLNIEGLPVYRDKIGGVGTPTSDEERTKLHMDTTNLLILINGYSGEKGIKEAVEYSMELLKRHAQAEDVEYCFYK